MTEQLWTLNVRFFNFRLPPEPRHMLTLIKKSKHRSNIVTTPQISLFQKRKELICLKVNTPVLGVAEKQVYFYQGTQIPLNNLYNNEELDIDANGNFNINIDIFKKGRKKERLECLQGKKNSIIKGKGMRLILEPYCVSDYIQKQCNVFA